MECMLIVVLQLKYKYGILVWPMQQCVYILPALYISLSSHHWSDVVSYQYLHSVFLLFLLIRYLIFYYFSLRKVLLIFWYFIFNIFLSLNTQQPHFCPVTAMHKYLSILKPQSGPLFQFVQDTTVNNTFITDKWSFIFRFLGINSQLYKGHSFCIGAATRAVILGFSEPYIRKLGRWNSTAVNKYIRINALKM